MRQNEQINQERGVSVRLGIHGLEILVGEAERTRTLKYKVTPLPRLSDFQTRNFFYLIVVRYLSIFPNYLL